MLTQRELIGDHPKKAIFSKWLKCDDKPVTATKNHRSLDPLIKTNDPELVEWLGKKIFDHHHSAYRIQKLKENYAKLGYTLYAEQHRKLPQADKVKKGNCTEVLLTEYIQSCLDRQLIKVFKLRYNPNVDQAIKGDDTLMVDVQNDGKSDKVRVYLGESKFRSTPTKKVVETLAKSLSKDKKPLSYSFLVDDLGRSTDTLELANLLDSFMIDEIKKKGDLIYAGFLLSDSTTSAVTQTHLKCDNPHMVLITVGLDDPEELVTEAFKYAENLVKNPTLV
ncbi:MAG: DUF1837 domain-containing protein [Flavisolibacter sp.]|nr:DUF1837 domain-containing protein [Flavisolibacter sp.]